MKTAGSVLKVLAGLFFAAATFWPIQMPAQEQQAGDDSKSQTEVYYFHFTHRCATCMAVERESKEALKALYPGQMESGEMTFLSVNLDEPTNEALARRLKVSGQTLLILKNGKRKDLTNTAFLYARTNPEKLKKAIGKAIENM
jgi:DNA-binding XRE family transcriptional regulator